MSRIDMLPDRLIETAAAIMPPEPEALKYRSVFVIGFARSGKTTLSRYLSRHYGFASLELDVIRQSRYSDLAVRRTFFDLLLRLYPRGLVVEGDNLSGENRSRPEIQAKPDFLETVERLKSRHAEIVLVGNADTTVDEKTAAINQYRQHNLCWTSQAKYGTGQIRNLAQRSIQYSRELRQFAYDVGVTYLDIRPTRYDLDVANAVEVMKSLLENDLAPQNIVS